MKNTAILILVLSVWPTITANGADPNLVGWWKFDGDANDSSGYGNHGTVYGAQWTTGKVDSALSFDGVDDYVECGNDVSLDLGSGSFTVAAWIKTDVTNELYDTIITHYCYGVVYPIDYRSVGISFDGSHHAQVGIRDNSLNLVVVTGTTNIEDGNWHHVAEVRDGSTLYLYVDGLLDGIPADASGVGDVVGPAPWMIGATETYTGIVNNYNGLIDEVRIYNRALSAEQILQLCQRLLPNKAFNPNPYDRARGVALNAVLSWRPGKHAVWHDVYFGTDFSDVNDANTTITLGVYKGRQDTNLYDPNGLDKGQTYYWRIDEVNDANIDSPWRGNIWSFKTITAYCMKETHPDYNDWLGGTNVTPAAPWSKPDCWCYNRQCRGDIDGKPIAPGVPMYVSLADLIIFRSAVGLMYEPPGRWPAGGICADLDHKAIAPGVPMRVTLADLTILRSYIGKMDMPPGMAVPCCDLDGDCVLTPQDHYNFWITP